MDWVQFVIFIGAMVGAMIIFYRLHKEELAAINGRIDRTELYHREDIQKMDERWEERWSKSEEKWEERWGRSEEKWERLFERLLLQDQRNS